VNTRLIAKLDVKPPFVVKPVMFEGLRKMGSPKDLANKYYNQGADEIFYIDIVASLYRREILLDQIKNACDEIFVPFAVGGGVKSIQDFSALFQSGADKVLINTYALQDDPSIIDKAAKMFGSQSVVVSIEAKKWSNHYECYSDCGRIRSETNVYEWMKEAESRGAGEILLQSVDRDGRKRGFDLELSANAVSLVNIPVVISSGCGKLEDIKDLVQHANPSGVAIASSLHYDDFTVNDVRDYLMMEGQ